MAEKEAFSYEVIRSGEEIILRVDCKALPYVPSIEDNPVVMARTIELLAKVGTVTKIVFVQKRDYEYDLRQVSLLQEIATIYKKLVKQRELFSVRAIGVNCIRWLEAKYATLRLRFFTMLREDPVGAYVMLRRAAREERLELNKVVNKEHADCLKKYIALLDYLVGLLDKTRLIALAKPYLVGYSIGDRSIYRRIFRPVIKPDFMFTKLMASYPAEAEAIDAYSVGETEVTIFKLPRTTQYLYHVIPPEFKLKEDHYDILDTARRIMAEHKPTRKEFVDPERMRRVFYNVGRDLLSELAEQKGILLREKNLDLLTQILVRYTVGFGLIEVILADQRIQDITINSPMGMLPMFVVHADYGDCITNIIPTAAEAEGWASKLRMISGRPLDEANPILDSEIILPVARARVCVIAPPLTPMGLGYAFRRHRDRPWTLPLFIANRMINPLTAGLLSFLVDGTRTMLIAGTRSAGKCVTGDTLIQLPDGRLVEIKDLVASHSKKQFYDGDGIVCIPDSNVSVFSLEDFKVKKKTINAFWKRKVNRLVRIKTKSGKEIITTPEHPYFVLENFTLKEIFAEELKKGDKIATPRIVRVKGKSVLIEPDKNYIANSTKEYFVLKSTRGKPVRFPKSMTEDLAEFLGYLAGDGAICENKIEFHNSNKYLRERYRELIKSLFGVDSREFKSHTTTVVQVTSKILSKMVADLMGIKFGKKASIISVPEAILKSNNKVLGAFLRAYFDCDGFVDKKRRTIELSTASKKMAKQIQLSLLRFGIIASLKSKKVKQYNNAVVYRIYIQGDEVNKFAKEIGFSHPKKKRRILSLKPSFANTNIDVIPKGGILIKELRKRLRLSNKCIRDKLGKDVWGYEQIKYNVPVKWFRKIINLFRERYEELLDLENYAALLEGYLDLIKRKEELFREFDLAIKKGSSYMKISKAASLSDGGLRKILQNKNRIPLVNSFNEIINLSSCVQQDICFDVSQEAIFSALSILREKLNLKLDELSKGVCRQTVSNYFNSRFKTNSLSTLEALIKNVLWIYRRTISEENKQLLENAYKIAYADIFWDTVVEVEKITLKDPIWVYDLNIEPTHNFVANGIIAHNTSFLGSLMVEIMRRYRIVTVEDTLELPVDALKKLNFNIQSMKVRSALARGGTELPADEGIRTALRLGDSALIIGEVRSKEALALYEAMRIGAMANLVAGTIHGESPYGVFDRVVNDLGVPRTSFKATDLIVIANPIRSPDGLHRWRRIVQVTEVRKHWETDPLLEHGFVDLLKYNPHTDQLEPTSDLINGDSDVIKAVAANVKEWAGNWSAVWDNIMLRAKIKETLVNYALKSKQHDLLEAEFVVVANDQFHTICEKVKEEIGSLDSKRIFSEWESWLKREIKRKRAAK